MQQAFTDWCKKHRIEPVSYALFAKDLKRLGVRKTRGGANGSRVYHDVAIT